MGQGGIVRGVKLSAVIAYPEVVLPDISEDRDKRGGGDVGAGGLDGLGQGAGGRQAE